AHAGQVAGHYRRGGVQVQGHCGGAFEVDGVGPGPSVQASGDRQVQGRVGCGAHVVEQAGVPLDFAADLVDGHAQGAGDEPQADRRGQRRGAPFGAPGQAGQAASGQRSAVGQVLVEPGADVGAAVGAPGGGDVGLQAAVFGAGGEDVGGEVGDHPQ